VSFSDAQLAFLRRMRVARLATVSAGGQPHAVPIVFAIDEQRLYTPLDHKPKRVDARGLKRVRNITENPRVSIVVDHYEEDWTHLAWIRIDGRAELVHEGDAHAAGVRLLTRKYPQYETMPLGGRPIIFVTPMRVVSWSGSG
jgi:PPOX class probable F420-dependent enzyme